LINKYLVYQDEILDLFNQGVSYIEIARELNDKYKLDVSPDYLRKSIKEIVRYLIADKEIVEYNVRLAKQKQRAQDLNRIANKSFRESARIENALADTHFNELVDIDSNKYDFEIASKRLQKFAHHIKRYAKFYGIKNILIAITGDLINSDRRLDEKLSMSTNRAKATFLGVHLLKHFILDLNQVSNIQVCCVTGNESRVNEELGWVDIVASDNYDFTIFEMLNLLLPEIHFIKGNALEIVVEINGQNLLVIHGHQLGRMDSNQAGKVISKYAAKGVIINMIICGHLHETMIRDNIARSASLVGSNAYSENALNLSGTAAQNIYIFTNDGRHDIRIDLQETDLWDGYPINKELSSYNAKSLNKTQEKQTIFKIII
jgi:predicted phosphodiesterase